MSSKYRAGSAVNVLALSKNVSTVAISSHVDLQHPDDATKLFTLKDLPWQSSVVGSKLGLAWGSHSTSQSAGAVPAEYNPTHACCSSSIPASAHTFHAGSAHNCVGKCVLAVATLQAVNVALARHA